MRDYITYVCIFIALILALCYLILTAPNLAIDRNLWAVLCVWTG